jgi:hypothetical protein
LYDRLYFALEHRIDIYLDSHIKHKETKKILKRAKVQLENGQLTVKEFEENTLPEGFVLAPTPQELEKLKRL